MANCPIGTATGLEIHIRDLTGSFVLPLGQIRGEKDRRFWFFFLISSVMKLKLFS